MTSAESVEFLHYLDETLWSETASGGRSQEFTPLYVDRYRGPRADGRAMAHEFWELSAVLEGAGTIEGAASLPLAVHDVALIPPGVTHREASREIMDTIWLGFRSSRLARRTFPRPAVVHSRPLTQFLEQLWIRARPRGEPIGPELDGLTATAVGWLLRLHRADRVAGDADGLTRVVRHLHTHYAEPIFLAELARRTGCSEGHFQRWFKRHTGQAPMQYLTRVRVQQAVHLLEHSAQPVAEIARQVGYDDPFYFSRVFKRLTGQSPALYRAKSRVVGGRASPRAAHHWAGYA